MSKIRLFPDMSGVSRGERRKLHSLTLIDKNDVPVPWVRLSKRMKMISRKEAQQLILLELERGKENVRFDLLHRLVVKANKLKQVEIEEKIKRYLK